MKHLELPRTYSDIRAEALEHIDTQYGVDFGAPAREPLAFHNGAHTRGVMNRFCLLASALGLTTREREIGLAAAAAHDIVQKQCNNEQLSTLWLGERLAKVPGLSDIEIDMGMLAILGTIPTFAKSTMAQRATTQPYPTRRLELVAHAVAGADMGDLFRPTGPLMAHRFLVETQGPSPRHEQMLAFEQSQIEFLECYQYPSREIENIMATHKPEVMRHIFGVISGIQRGEIENIADLFAADKKFESACLI